MELRLCLLLTLLSSLKAVNGLTITVNLYGNGTANGTGARTELFRYENDNSALEGRSYSLPSNEGDRIIGHLLLPGVDSSLCEFIPSVDVNLTLIAFVKSFYNCPLDLEHNIYNAGYSALLVYTPLSDIILTSKTNLPRAMFSSMKLAKNLDSILGANYTYNEYVYVEVWDDSIAKLERLFVIFGSILLASVVLAIALFCCTFFCRALISKWRTRGLSRWQVRRLPRRKYRKAKDTTETCSICLEDFKEGGTIRVLPCEHIFHPKCVDEWLQKWNRTCPLCKSTIKRSKGARRAHIDPDETSGLLSEEGGASSARTSFNDETDYGTTHIVPVLGPGQPSIAESPSSMELGLSPDSHASERTFHTPVPFMDGETASYQTADEGQMTDIDDAN